MNQTLRDTQDTSITFSAGGEPILVINEEGFHYKGEKIDDAGKAHKAWMEAMGAVASGRYEGRAQAALHPGHDEDDYEGAMDCDPSYILERITYGMVEGGYMPSPRRENLGEAILGTQRCLQHMAGDEHLDDPQWLRHAFRAMVRDVRLLKALVREVFIHGWAQGGSWVEGVNMTELDNIIPQTPEERIAMYLVRFNEKMVTADYHPVAFREDLDYIPCDVSPSGEAWWEIYHVPSGFTIDAGIASESTVLERMKDFPSVEEGGADD